jgi:hypothetical protein
MEKLLLPLRIPAGWCVLYNKWYAVSPEEVDSEKWLKEDLLQLENSTLNLIADVGWYGNKFLDGKFTVFLYKENFLGEKLAEYNSRNYIEVVNVLELWLEQRNA